MTDFFVYETATGLVRWHTQSVPATLDEGLASIAVPAAADPKSPGNYSIVNGAVVARVYTLAQNQAIKIRAAIAYLNGLFVSPNGFTYAGKLYQIDSASQSNITAMGALALGSIADPANSPWPAGFYWIAADNSHVPMDAPATYAFSRAVASYVSAAILNCRAVKDAIAAAATQAVLDAIDVTAGYPASSA